jgi:hypothetical protein
MSADQDLELAAVQSVLAGTAGPADRTRAAARMSLLAAIAAENAHARAPGGRSRRRIGRLVPLATLASAAAAAGIAVLISQVLVRGGAVQPQPAAAALLRRAADAALASPPAQLGPHQYWYEENQGTYLDTAITTHGAISAYVSQVSRYWIGARHWQRQDHLVKVRAVGPVTQPWQRTALARFGSNPSLTGTGNGFDLPMPYNQMLKAPASLRGLASFVAPRLKEAVPYPSETKRAFDAAILFTGIHDILIEPMVPARLQAALFRLEATIPGVHDLGLTHDTLGRAAVAVGFADHHHGVLAEFLFDPVSYALLDYRETALERRGRYIPAGTVMEETAFVKAGLVHRAPTSCPGCVRS